MKSTRIHKLMIATLALIILHGCGENKKDDAVVADRGRGGTSDPGAQASIQGLPSQESKAGMGFVWVSSQYDDQYQQMIRALIAGSVDPSHPDIDLQRVNISNGISFVPFKITGENQASLAVFERNSDGTVQTSQFGMYIQIVDEAARQNRKAPFELKPMMKSGRLTIHSSPKAVANQSSTTEIGEGVFVFEDSDGSITFTGKAYRFAVSGGDQYLFSGAVTFDNAHVHSWAVNGIRSGTLGSFSIPLCSLIKCQ